MKKEIITINPAAPVSKYRQIIDSVRTAIAEGKLLQGEKMPSINAICNKWDLSRDTVVNAYSELKSLGIISSAPGKGFYVESTNVKITNRVFLLFDEINAFKEDLYNSFLENIDKSTTVDIFFHYFNRRVFDRLIEEAKGHYTTYVIMPAKFKNTLSLLEQTGGRLIILDQLPDDLNGHFPSVFQNFEKDVFNALLSGKHLLSRYKKIIMVYPGGKEPEGQYLGFERFCRENGFDFETINNLDNRKPAEGECYIVIWDRDLVKIIKMSEEQKLKPGKDLGIISYNDSALKEVVANGITTISTDFRMMGQTLARLVAKKTDEKIENPSSLIIRGSL
jgi:DNA-binding transcriptional regulator YhcF (GntR family)